MKFKSDGTIPDLYNNIIYKFDPEAQILHQLDKLMVYLQDAELTIKKSTKKKNENNQINWLNITKSSQIESIISSSIPIIKSDIYCIFLLYKASKNNMGRFRLDNSFRKLNESDIQKMEKIIDDLKSKSKKFEKIISNNNSTASMDQDEDITLDGMKFEICRISCKEAELNICCELEMKKWAAAARGANPEKIIAAKYLDILGSVLYLFARHQH